MLGYSFKAKDSRMANRLTRIVTRTGDDGTTGLADGSRLPKSDLRFHVLGELDELNATIGVVRCEDLPPDVDGLLRQVQNRLFDLGSEFALPGYVAIGEAHLSALDESVGAWNAALPPLKEFVLPGGHRAAALLHVARTTCRRAERSLVALREEDASQGSALGQAWLNRLSDVLFVAARVVNRERGVAEPTWEAARPSQATPAKE
jgi:cob(I)alamin adenosyltransferase